MNREVRYFTNPTIARKLIKRTMSWNTYLSLIFFYDTVENTSQMIRELGVYPTQLAEQFNDITTT